MEKITPEQMRTKIESDMKFREFITSGPRNISNTIQKIRIFGKYNGKTVKWDVIDVNSKENKSLVITEDIEVPDIAGSGSLIKDWSGSEIRKWLNGTFFNTAFSALEQAQILTTKVETCYEENPESKVETEDKIFLLSSSEIKDEETKSNLQLFVIGHKLATENALLRDGCGNAGKIRPVMWINLNGIDKVLEDREKRNKPLQERLKFFGRYSNEPFVPIPQTWEVIDVSENIATISPLMDYVDCLRAKTGQRFPGRLGDNGFIFPPISARMAGSKIEFSKEESEKIVFKKEGVDGYIQIKIDSDLDRLVETRVKESERFIIDEEPELQIIFGKFDDCGSGEAKPIEWNVLYKDGDKALVYANLVAMSSKWLNDVFYNTAFSDEEKGKIVPNSNSDSMFLLGRTREFLPIYTAEQIKRNYSADFTPAMWVKIDSDVIEQEKSQEKKGRTLTPEEMQARLETEKRRRELFTEICHPPVVTISPDHPAGQNSDTKLVAIKESDKFSIFPDGTINKIGKVLPNGEFEPSDGFCVRDGILYQLVKIGKLSPTWDIEPIEPIREKVDSETKTPPTKFEVTRDGVIISHGGTGLNCIIGEVLPNGEVKPKDGWSCDFRVRDGIIYLVHNGKEEEIGRITEEMKEGFEKRRLEGEKLVENLEKMRRKKLEEKLKNGGEK